jgi:hypothetical protein
LLPAVQNSRTSLTRDVSPEAGRPIRRDSLPSASVRPHRALAARLLAGQILRLGRANAIVERRLGQGLLRLNSGSRYRLLGYVRLGDYLTERLGMSLRRCQVLLRTERALGDLPALAREFDAGGLEVSKLRVIAGVATPGTQERWLDLARRLTVRQLEEKARAARKAVAAPAVVEAPAPAVVPVDPTAPASSPSSPALSGDEEPGVLISIACPGRVVAVWHWALDLVRRVAGRQEPAWRCAEYLAAEFLSGVPESPPAGAAEGSSPDLEPAATPVAPVAGPDSPAPDRSARREGSVGTFERESGRRESEDVRIWLEAAEAARDAMRPLGASADPESILTGRSAAFSAARLASSDSPDADAWDLDRHLRGMVRIRQSLAWRQGRLLSTFTCRALHRELGFASLEDFCHEELGMSPRRARYLITLDRRLASLPLLADAYRRGQVSWCQARLLVRIVRPGTQSRWIRYARQVTVRRLEDAVVACEVEGASGENGGTGAGREAVAPLPPTEPSPDLHMCAPTPDASVAVPATRTLTDAGGRRAAADADAVTGPVELHMCAPPPSPGDGARALWNARANSRIVFWAPLDVAALWESALRSCRRESSRFPGGAGCSLADWECLLAFVQALRDTWENPDDPGWRRRYRIFERDGWRCRAPGCTSRANLHEHHVRFRSQGGGDEEDNLVTLCVGHHQQGIHAGRVSCCGRAPGALWWELGVRPDGPPLARYFGDRLVGAGARAVRVSDGRAIDDRVALEAVGPARSSGQ